MDVSVPHNGLTALEAQILGKLEGGEELDPFERLEYQNVTAVDEPGAPMPGVILLSETEFGTVSLAEVLQRARHDVDRFVLIAVEQPRRKRSQGARGPLCGSRHRRSRRGRVSRGHARRTATSRDDGDGGPGGDGEVDRGAGRGGAP